MPEPVPARGYLFRIIGLRVPKDSTKLQTIAIAIAYPLKIEVKTLLLKIPHAWIIEHGEMKLAMTSHDIGGKQQSSLVLICEIQSSINE